MAEQHGMQPEHHVHQAERDFFERARERLDRSLQHIAEMEQRMARNLSGGAAKHRRRAPVDDSGSTT